MSTVFNERSSDTARYDRDVINTGVTTQVPNYAAARSLWTESVPESGNFDTPPLLGYETVWTIS